MNNIIKNKKKFEKNIRECMLTFRVGWKTDDDTILMMMKKRN